VALLLNARKRFPTLTIDIDLELKGGLAVLFGPSGSGKSTLLNMIAGIVRPDEGRIEIHGRPVFDRALAIDLPMQGRRVGYLFQDYALFPHMTVEQNVAYGLWGQSRAAIRHRVAELVGIMGLDGHETSWPSELSGGQKQRVALARTLAVAPEVLLLDEPLSALDRPARERLRHDLLAILEEFQVMTVLVTHDLEEAYLMAKEIAVIDGGKVLQVGNREEVLHRPRSRRVAAHTGTKNILRGVASRDGLGRWGIEWLGRHLGVEGGVPAGAGEVEFCIRPEDIRLVWPEKVSQRANVLRGRIVREIERGLDYLLFVAIGETGHRRRYDLEIQVRSHLRQLMMLHVGKDVFLSLPPDRLHLLAPDE
jgi:ABC-type Fe3+/spermidine/putrescine transport system ATPase subunit